MSSSSQIVDSWISTYCNLFGHEYLAEVSEDFIEDDFNLTGLSSGIPMYKEALELILDIEPEDPASDEDDDLEEEDPDDDDDDDQLPDINDPRYNNSNNDDPSNPASYRRSRKSQRSQPDIHVKIENSAELLYGLIHQRFITSRAGMSQMHEKYELGHFGSCPRILCHGCKVLPVGCSDSPGEDTVKLFCPSCFDIYNPPNSRFHSIDGAYFGTTFGSLFFMTFPELQLTSSAGDLNASSPARLAPGQHGQAELNGTSVANFAPGLGKGRIYDPKIYGFKVSERAKTGPRMKWLRMKPDDVRELDEVRRYHSRRSAGAAGDEDEEQDDADDNEGAEIDPAARGGGEQQQQQYVASQNQNQSVDRRKKAPMRRRRVGSGGSAVANGVNGGGG